jgi:hypothetical protein
MSFEATAIAMNHSRSKGTARLVLLGIASHDGDGGSWPSVATLARYANVTPRNVQKAVATLEDLHEIRRHQQQGGTVLTDDFRRPNLYEFILRCPADCDHSKQHRTRRESVQLALPAVDADPLSVATPPVGSDTPPLSVATPELPKNLPTTSKKKSPVRNRARGACGHDLIDERHCERGCHAQAVKGTAA